MARCETMTDWSILDDPRVWSTIEAATAAVAARYRGIVEKDDLFQDAVIMAASRADKVRWYMARGGYGFYVDLSRDLANRARAEARRASRAVSRDAMGYRPRRRL